jgi:hypothetical protein
MISFYTFDEEVALTRDLWRNAINFTATRNAAREFVSFLKTERRFFMLQAPTVGRIVHFYDDTSVEPQAAIITKVWSDDCVNLVVFGDGSMNNVPARTVTSVTTSEGSSQRWAWPPRA